MRLNVTASFLLAFLCCLLWSLPASAYSNVDETEPIGTGVYILGESTFFDPTSPEYDREITAIIPPRFGQVTTDDSGELIYTPLSVNDEFEDEFFAVVNRTGFGYEVYRGVYDPMAGVFELQVPSQLEITNLALGAGTPSGFNALMLVLPPKQDGQLPRKIVIGIHSSVEPNAGYTAGHAWISVHDSDTGVTTTFGLWPDSHPLTEDNGSGSDVRTGMEDNLPPKHSRYKEITPEQLQNFVDFTEIVDHWGYTHTCAEWATDAWQHTTNEWINPNDNFGFETPRMVSRSIKALEANDPTLPPGGTAGGGLGGGGAQGGGAQGGGGTSCCGG